MKDIEKLKKALNKAILICEENAEKAHNIDLFDMSETLERFVEDLNWAGDFETYDEE